MQPQLHQGGVNKLTFLATCTVFAQVQQWFYILMDSIRVKIDIGIMLLPVSHDLLPGNRVFQMRDCLKFISDFKLTALRYSSNQPTPHPI